MIERERVNQMTVSYKHSQGVMGEVKHGLSSKTGLEMKTKKVDGECERKKGGEWGEVARDTGREEERASLGSCLSRQTGDAVRCAHHL